mmetsp:Transcript_47085/g.64116  ORF Transcript_47085/g.64116 Transcript_47085/m.64116 type:complete len:80 (+) Transcript_47085:1570-1809(+)
MNIIENLSGDTDPPRLSNSITLIPAKTGSFVLAQLLFARMTLDGCLFAKRPLKYGKGNFSPQPSENNSAPASVPEMWVL